MTKKQQQRCELAIVKIMQFTKIYAVPLGYILANFIINILHNSGYQLDFVIMRTIIEAFGIGGETVPKGGELAVIITMILVYFTRNTNGVDLEIIKTKHKKQNGTKVSQNNINK